MHPKSLPSPVWTTIRKKGHRWLLLADKALNAPESVATVRLEDFPDLKAA